MLSFFNAFRKRTLISFYKEGGVFFAQKLEVKNKKVLSRRNFIFEKEKFLRNFIKDSLMENTFTYVSTLITHFNQGCVDSCSSRRYKELGVKTDSIKILCIDKKFSIYIGIFELNEFKKYTKEYAVDLIYSPYLIVHLNKETSQNALYLLITKEIAVIVIYSNKGVPAYSAIFEFKKDDKFSTLNTLDSADREMREIDIDENDADNELDNENSLESLENLDKDINQEELENSDSGGETLELKEEQDIVNFVKDSLKDYYDNYGDEFIQVIYVLKTYDLDTKFIKDLESELLVKVKTKKISLLNDINSLARKDINV